MSEETVSTETSITKVLTALGKAQSEFPPVVKNKVNPFYNNAPYADLSTIFEVTKPVLLKHGIVVTQLPISQYNSTDPLASLAGVKTILFHTSGESLSNELLLPAKGKAKDGAPKYDAQTIGAALTYARRISYQSIVGVAAEDDDDGNSISQENPKAAPSSSKPAPPKAKPQIPQNEQPATEGITDDQYNDYIKKAKSAGDRLKAAGLTDSNNLNVNQKLKGFILKMTAKGNLKELSVDDWTASLKLVEDLIEKKELDTIWKEE